MKKIRMWIKRGIVLGLLLWMLIGGVMFVIQDFSIGSLALLFGLFMIAFYKVLTYFFPKFQKQKNEKKEVFDDL